MENLLPINNYEQLLHHRSIRRYRPTEIDQAILDKILLAATRASTSGNMQAYSIIVTTDFRIRQKLYEPHFEQSMVLEAPCLMTFCADFRRMKKWLKVNNAAENFDNFMSFMIAAIDATLASQNAALAAESLGLGICYMGTTLANCRKIGEVLECPPGVVPVVGFSLGYPAEAPPQRDRLPLEGLVHRETYRDQSEDEIREIYRQKEQLGRERIKSAGDLKVQNLAQYYTTVKYTRASHVEYTNTVLNYLLEQDFWNNH